jgi:hypothetical protein
MLINRQKIQKLHALTREVAKSQDVVSETVRTAQDRYNHVEEKVERDGKVQKIKRKLLWDEVFYLGANCQAAKILKGYHPEVFEALEAQNKAADELKKFTIAELDMDYSQMRLSDYVKLTEALFDLMWEERKEAAGGNVPSTFPSDGGGGNGPDEPGGGGVAARV